MKKNNISFLLILFAFLLYKLTPSFATTVEGKSDKNETILEREIITKNTADKYPDIVNLYNPSYVLPFYRTNNPFQQVYFNATPNNQLLKRDELKAYFSFLIPLFRHLYKNKPVALNFAYSQLMFWQVYAKSQYFRETNYEPELFIENYFNRCLATQLGVSHQSNGRGGYLERSWNRAYLQLKLTGRQWLFQLRGWAVIAADQSSNLHNPNIAYYLGYENILFSYKLRQLKASIEAQNIESGFTRGFVKISVSYPILKSISLYAQLFNGYGQSLIEYNHKSTGFGIGVSLNDWIN